VVDDLQVLLDFGQPRGHVGAVGRQEGKSFLLVAGPGGYELGVAPDGPVRGMPALTAGLCLLPVGVLIAVLAPRTGAMVGARGPRLPLVVSGAALALGGGVSIWLGPATPLPAVLAIYLLFGIFQGTINPPITNSAVSGMPRSMAGVATSLASAGRQTGTTLGVAISGTIVGSALARGGMAVTSAEHGVRCPEGGAARAHLARGGPVLRVRPAPVQWTRQAIPGSLAAQVTTWSWVPLTAESAGSARHSPDAGFTRLTPDR
jgi:MFS family permease